MSTLTLTNTSLKGLRERELIQSLAETRWRLNRSFALEAALFSQPAADAEEGTPAPSNVENLIKYEKTLKNLHLQEARLSRRFEKDIAELRELQQTRLREEMLRGDTPGANTNGDPKMASNFQMLKELLAADSKPFMSPRSRFGARSVSEGLTRS